ncbi:MAG TPA: DUF305 domain-containing protein [Rhizobiaceae bacterium]
MNTLKTVLAAAIAAASFAVPALSQDQQFKLPEQCAAAGGMHHGAHGGGMGGMMGMDSQSMTDFQRENMEKMQATMPAMMQGMMNEDPDVAFACAMIAHHQGAIDMAGVELEYGKDEQLRALARKIVDAQVREIDEMTKWIDAHAK